MIIKMRVEMKSEKKTSKRNASRTKSTLKLAAQLSTSYCESIVQPSELYFSSIQRQYDKTLKNTNLANASFGSDEFNEIFVDTIQNKYHKRLYKDCQEIVSHLRTIQMQYNKFLYRDSYIC